MIDHVTTCQFAMNILQRNAHLGHQYHHVVSQVGNLVDGFFFIAGLGSDDYFRGFFADFFENFVQTFFEKKIRFL